jgi:hypothetical protein
LYTVRPTNTVVKRLAGTNLLLPKPLMVGEGALQNL